MVCLQRGRCTSVTGPVPGQPGEVGLVPPLATLLSRLDGSSMSGLPGKQTVNTDPMPRDALTFGDLIGKLDMIHVECRKCARHGRHQVE